MMSRGIASGMVAVADRERLHHLLAGRTVWLASSSPRRRAILRAYGVPFREVGHTLCEPPPAGPDWRRWVRSWSLRKARNAARPLTDNWVIGSDTIVVCRGRGLGKPAHAAEAAAMLARLSGHVHQVFSGVAIVDGRSGAQATGSAVTSVHFRTLKRQEIGAYIRTGEPLDKAGAYAIQGRARAFVSQIDGPLDNVVGLPVQTLIKIMERVSR